MGAHMSMGWRLRCFAWCGHPFGCCLPSGTSAYYWYDPWTSPAVLKTSLHNKLDWHALTLAKNACGNTTTARVEENWCLSCKSGPRSLCTQSLSPARLLTLARLLPGLFSTLSHIWDWHAHMLIALGKKWDVILDERTRLKTVMNSSDERSV